MTAASRLRPPWPCPALAGAARAAPAAAMTADGALIRPDGVERWITVGASLGLGYSDPTEDGAGRFPPGVSGARAYEHYRRTGGFPEGTMLALVIPPPGRRVAPAGQGVFAGSRGGWKWR